MSVTIAIFSDSVLTLLMILLTSVPQNTRTLYLADCDRIYAILSMVVDGFFCLCSCSNEN